MPRSTKKHIIIMDDCSSMVNQGKNDMLQRFNYNLYGYLGIMIIGFLRENNGLFSNTYKQLSKNSF